LSVSPVNPNQLFEIIVKECDEFILSFGGLKNKQVLFNLPDPPFINNCIPLQQQVITTSDHSAFTFAATLTHALINNSSFASILGVVAAGYH
jgi:hypothetical protein